MFERFTEPARQVIVVAQDEATHVLRHNYIGTEHILLGLLREGDGPAARALESLGVRLDDVRDQVRRIIGQGEEPTKGQMPFTPRAKKVLELALREAVALGHEHIGPEHILLGVVRDNEGVASRILLDHGADAEKVRNQVLSDLRTAPPPHYEETMRRAADREPVRWLPAALGPLVLAVALGVGILIGWAIWS